MSKTKTKLFKKIQVFLLVLSLFQSHYAAIASSVIIKDELVESTLKDKNLTFEKYEKPVIQDELTKFLDYIEKPQVRKGLIIENEDVHYLKTVKKPYVNENITIENEDIKNLNYDRIDILDNVNNADFQDTLNVLKIKPVKIISAKNCHLGQYVEFKTIGNTRYKDNYIEDGTSIIGKITNITDNAFGGTPGDITIENFQFKDKSKRNFRLEGTINKHGANRTLWIVPLTVATNFFTFCGGYLFYIIKGGHTKLKPGDEFELEILHN